MDVAPEHRGAGWHASGLSKGIGVLFPGGPGIFFPLDVSPALNTSICSRVNFLRWWWFVWEKCDVLPAGLQKSLRLFQRLSKSLGAGSLLKYPRLIITSRHFWDDQPIFMPVNSLRRHSCACALGFSSVINSLFSWKTISIPAFADVPDAESYFTTHELLDATIRNSYPSSTEVYTMHSLLLQHLRFLVRRKKLISQQGLRSLWPKAPEYRFLQMKSWRMPKIWPSLLSPPIDLLRSKITLIIHCTLIYRCNRSWRRKDALGSG